MRTEEMKKLLMGNVPDDGFISLQDLWDQVGEGWGEFSGALQSLVSRGEIIASGNGGGPDDILLGRSGRAGDGNKKISGREIRSSVKLITAGMPGLKAAVAARAGEKIREILSDGLPRTREQLAGSVEMPPKMPGALPDIVMLPDNTYTLKDTPAGQAELARRVEESRARVEAVKRQRQRIDVLLEENETPNRHDIEQFLGEDLLPEAVSHLLRLPGGLYTQPDSEAAWEEVGKYLAKTEPVNRKEFIRMFKRHKKLVSHIKKGREEPPFVILPDGSITVDTHPAGREEIRRREILAYVHYTLKERMGGRSFFTLDDFAPRERTLAKQEALQAGCVELKMGRQEMFCAPIKADSAKIARELGEITGLDLPYRGGAVRPVVYLMENSLTARETGKALAIHPGDVANLYEQGYLKGFQLEGSQRYWRPSVEQMHRSPNLERLLRRAEKVKMGDAARMLGLIPDQVKRLIREGHLHSAGRSIQGAHQLRRGDVEDLLERLPDILTGWGEVPGQGTERVVRRNKRRPRRKAQVQVQPPGPLKLDEFQVKAIDALLNGHSVLVAAPTGTGKTLIAEKLVEHILEKQREVIYTSPIKALSNQKYRDFGRMYGYHQVGLITGDISINERASLLVMTTEIFRNWCFANPEWMEGISHVIFDEIHFLDDIERGTAWEESIIFAPSHIRILGLSATVPNIHELARWMEDVRGSEVVVVEEYRRAVPLKINWISPDNEVLEEDDAVDEIEALRQVGSRRMYMQGHGGRGD